MNVVEFFKVVELKISDLFFCEYIFELISSYTVSLIFNGFSKVCFPGFIKLCSRAFKRHFGVETGKYDTDNLCSVLRSDINELHTCSSIWHPPYLFFFKSSYLFFFFFFESLSANTHTVVLKKRSTKLTSTCRPGLLSAELFIGNRLCTYFDIISKANKS